MALASLHGVKWYRVTHLCAHGAVRLTGSVLGKPKELVTTVRHGGCQAKNSSAVQGKLRQQHSMHILHNSLIL